MGALSTAESIEPEPSPAGGARSVRGCFSSRQFASWAEVQAFADSLEVFSLARCLGLFALKPRFDGLVLLLEVVQASGPSSFHSFMELTDVYQHRFLSARVALQIGRLEQHRIFNSVDNVVDHGCGLLDLTDNPTKFIESLLHRVDKGGYSLRVPVQGREA